MHITARTHRHMESEILSQICQEHCERTLAVTVGQCINCKACAKSCPNKFLDADWLELGTIRLAPVCRNCCNPRCVSSCKKNAIRKDNGRITIDPVACVRCGMCARACPFQMIHIITDNRSAKSLSTNTAPANKVISKCDQCSGRNAPTCIAECPTGALRFCHYKELVKLMASSMPHRDDAPNLSPSTPIVGRLSFWLAQTMKVISGVMFFLS